MTPSYLGSDPISDSQGEGSELLAHTSHGSSPYNRANEDFETHQTIATLPLSPANHPSPTHVTQPTQILDTPIARKTDPNSYVQVAASSPSQVTQLQSPSQLMFTATRHLMQLPGTCVRRSQPIAPKPIILSDDDPPTGLRSDSEDEAIILRSNIPHTVFASGGRSQACFVEDSSRENRSRFKDLNLSHFAYSGPQDRDSIGPQASIPQKRPSDTASSDVVSRKRRPLQSRPSRAQPVQEDMKLEDILESCVRRDVERMSNIFSNKSIRSLFEALEARMFKFEDAMDYVAQMDDATLNGLDLSDDELQLPALSTVRSKPKFKRHVQAPSGSIAEKYGIAQAISLQKVARPSYSPESTPPKRRRRLVRGRRQPSPNPPSSPSRSPVIRSSTRSGAISLDSNEDGDANSGDLGDVNQQEEEVSGDALLHFINTCSAKDLADLSNQSESISNTIISYRPFRTLEEVRSVSTDELSKTLSKSGKKRAIRKPIGDKVIDICLEMWTGYEAVDDLVSEIEAKGEIIRKEMYKWGVDIFGASKDGELELTNFDRICVDPNSRDSGIGTPASSLSGVEDDAKLDGLPNMTTRTKTAFIGRPLNMADTLILKDYQIVGLNWLKLLWSKRMSCILADDMGLGKTCQVIAFLSHLVETGVYGPHLVVVPGSTLENWIREFGNFSPSLVVQPYYGSQKERNELQVKIQDRIEEISVIITTYDCACKPSDNKFLRSFKVATCVFDEGHTLKNSTTKRYTQLMRIKAEFRLLLTGTPLQNNLHELVSLLAFIMPSLFEERKENLASIFKIKTKTTDSEHTALLSTQRIARARSMMTPFILRRKKYQVLKHLPKKVCRVEYCELTGNQRDIYKKRLEEQREILQDRAEGRPNNNHANVMMSLRQAAIHPLLFRKIYDDRKIRRMARACLKEDKLVGRNEQYIYEDMQLYTDFGLHRLCEEFPTTLSKYALNNSEWMDSGKVQKLCELLKTFHANGDRTLIFSQFTMVMDILESVLEELNMPFFRLDGSTPIPDRQTMLDEFTRDTTIPVFLLSTKSGGAGINLACANKVIIFDSSFNPQDDIQAENRAHRVGQTKDVEVIRLVTRGTIEEQIYALGQSKLALDARVAGEVSEETDDRKIEEEAIGWVEQMMLKDISEKRSVQGMGKDLKDEYLAHLKAAGLDMSAV